MNIKKMASPFRLYSANDLHSDDSLIDMSTRAVDITSKAIQEGKQISWNRDLGHGKKLLKETIGTEQGGEDFVTKITYDVYAGRERVPLLYNPIYTTTVDANYPKSLIEKNLGPVQVVFVTVLEHEGVRFGRLGAGETKTIEFFTYAAGIEITQDMIEYNETWEITEVSTAFGEAYNKLLNHIHLNPIISANYTTSVGGLAAQREAQYADTPQLVAWSTDLETTLKNALQVLPNGTVILANSFDANKIETALYGSMYADNSPSILKRQIQTSNIIYYDGDEITVGDKVYEYEGVTAGYLYLLVPKRQFRERVKHDLRLETISANPKRLVAGGSVGVTRRAVFAGLSGRYGAIKVDIAA